MEIPLNVFIGHVNGSPSKKKKENGPHFLNSHCHFLVAVFCCCCCCFFVVVVVVCLFVLGGGHYLSDFFMFGQLFVA